MTIDKQKILRQAKTQPQSPPQTSPKLSSEPAVIIFDCDGVLVDSEKIANQVLVEQLNGCGCQVTLEDCFRDYVGKKMSVCVELIESQFERKLPGNFLDELQDKTFQKLRMEVNAVEEVVALQDYLVEKKIKSCVASSGSYEKMAVTLAKSGLKPYFSDANIFSASEVVNGKPAPDLFIFAAEKMNANIRNCWVVEDSVPGIEAAIASGAEVIAYAGTLGVERINKNFSSDRVQIIESMHELIQLL